MSSADHLEPVASELLPPPPSTAAIARIAGGPIVTPAVQTAKAVEAIDAYRHLCEAILDRSDYQRIGRRDFPKKSAWRKLAVAFNVSSTIAERVYERDANNRIVRAEVVVRATAPNGRTMDGLGACDLFEKCCGRARGGECTIKAQSHDHCPEGCDGLRHFSNPSHDLPATAMTRATNRACADLFGMGEVSAEEVGQADAWRGAEGDDQRSWWEQNGWDDQEEHDRARAALFEALKRLPREVGEAYREWRVSEGIDLKQASTRDEFDKLQAHYEEVAPTTSPDATSATQGDAEGKGGTDTAEAPPEPATGPSADDEAPPVDEAAISERVGKMTGDEVNNRLAAAKLPKTGSVDERRARLADYWSEQAAKRTNGG